MKDKIFEPRERCEDMFDHRISTRNLAVVKFKPATIKSGLNGIRKK